MSFMKDFDHLKIPMEDILLATNNFDPTKVIGCGGFGSVYKGLLSSPKGQITYAFKRLNRGLGQGNIEFWKEIMMLSQYKHENLISLEHFCIEGEEMILVYNYASRGSLDRYLTDPNTLTWIQRLKICVGAARGLHFLHDPKETQQRVLHRDIKSANILLDENWSAKVSDFGLSKFGPANQAYSYLVSRVVGTPGYCDPLYWELGFLSKKSDVYSFGVVLFEILCGRLCYEYCNYELTKILVPMWRRCYNQKRLDEIILAGLKEQMHPGSLKSFSAIAYQCVQKTHEERPAMAEIVKELEFSLKQQEIFESTRFQILGDAKPGAKLLACRVAMGGTSLCMFQWVRHFGDGNWKYIDGATDPEYGVTADDVDTFIAVECTPTDGQGKKGELVRLFANEQNKIVCDPKMQQEIDKYISTGQATFNARVLRSEQISQDLHFSEDMFKADYYECWKHAKFSLTRSKCQIEIGGILECEKCYWNLSITIPSARASQIILSHSSRRYAYSFHDFRMRDTFVLTMRMFQRKSKGA